METLNKPLSDTLSLSAPVFLDLITGALVCTDKSLPTLAAIYLERGENSLSATSTDRYRLINGTIELEGSSNQWSAIISRKDSERLIAALKSALKASPLREITLTLDSGALSVTIGADTLTLYLLEDKFPPYAHLMEGKPAPVESVAYDPKLLGEFSKVPASAATKKSKAALLITFTGDGKPALVSIAHDSIQWRGLVMPMRTK